MKKLIIFTTVAILVATISTGAACAAEPSHWADPYITACLENGVIDEVQDPEEVIRYEDYLGMLQKSGIQESNLTCTRESILKHEAAELIAGYLTKTYATKENDDILWNRLTFLSETEIKEIAEYQNVEKSFVKPLVLLYSCGIMDADGCEANSELKFGEACALLSRFLDYKNLCYDKDALCIFYTMHCPCALSGKDC